MPREEEYVSCRDFIRLNAMSGALLLSGEDRLGEKITRANVIEMTDMGNWAQPGEVILCSGYAFRDNEEQLLRAVEALSEKGAVALCIKPRHFYHSISQNIIKKAKELGFILIELPMEAIFANIVHEITEEIFQRESLAFRNMQDRMEVLLDILFQDDSMEQRLNAIEAEIENPFLIFDSDNELVMSKSTRQLLDAIQEDVLRQLYHNPHEGSLLVELNGSTRSVHTYRVDISGNEFIRIILIAYHGPFRETDLIAVKRISRILALEMKNTMTFKKILRKYKDKFVQDWLFNNFDSELDIIIAAQTYGYTLSAAKQYRVCVININNKQHNAAFLERDVSIIHSIIMNLDANMAFTIHNGKLILVFESDMEDEAVNFPHLSYLIDKLKYVLEKQNMSFCISRPVEARAVPSAYQQAKRISEISDRCNITDPFIKDERLGILSLLSMLPEDNSVSQYRDKLLGPLQRYDEDTHSNLMETLQAYLDTKCNAKATAEKMYIHYNTIAYRLDKIRNLIGMDIDDAETRLQLQIAFKLRLIQP